MLSDTDFAQPQRESGQAMVEFALVLMFVILPFIFVLIDGAVTLYTQAALTNVAREGARGGSIYQYQCDPAVTPLCSLFYTQPFASQVATIDNGRRTYVRGEIQRMVGPLVPFSSCTTKIGYPDSNTDPPPLPELGNPYRELDSMSVLVACPRRLFFGLVGTSQITLTAQSTMRIEPGGVAVPTPSP